MEKVALPLGWSFPHGKKYMSTPPLLGCHHLVWDLTVQRCEFLFLRFLSGKYCGVSPVHNTLHQKRNLYILVWLLELYGVGIFTNIIKLESEPFVEKRLWLFEVGHCVVLLMPVGFLCWREAFWKLDQRLFNGCVFDNETLIISTKSQKGLWSIQVWRLGPSGKVGQWVHGSGNIHMAETICPRYLTWHLSKEVFRPTSARWSWTLRVSLGALLMFTWSGHQGNYGIQEGSYFLPLSPLKCGFGLPLLLVGFFQTDRIQADR